MKRQLVLLVMMILVLSGVVMGGEEPGEVPELEAKSVILTSTAGLHIGGPNEGSVYRGGSNGFLGYSVVVEPELKPTEELVRLIQQRFLEPEFSPSGRLSLDHETRTVLYRAGNTKMRLPFEHTSGFIAHHPDERIVSAWSATVDSPTTMDVLLVLSESSPTTVRVLLFAVRSADPHRWLVSMIPVLFTPVDYVRLNSRDGLGLYQEGDQLALFLPMSFEDQAWEIHLPKTFENFQDVLRFNIFPLAKKSQ